MSTSDLSHLPPQLVEAVVRAAEAAASRLPSSEPLQPGAASADPGQQGLVPADAAGGVSARLSGAVQGEAVLVVADELVQALNDSPLGTLELAPAVQPALEEAAATLGQVVVEQARPLPVEVAMDGLAAVGATVVVPLITAQGRVRATFALAVDVQASTAAASDGARGTSAGDSSAGVGASSPPAGAGKIPQARRAAGLELLRDVEMEVTAELGRTRMTVRELLSLTPGAVVELDRTAGSPADVLVNGTLLARGEVVVVDEDFGIRITEIVVDPGESAEPAPLAPTEHPANE